MAEKKITCFWFRRDLRLDDNAGLWHALNSGNPVLAVFIFDKHILDDLNDPKDKRVQFIHQEVAAMKSRLEEWGSSLLVKYGEPQEIWKQLVETHDIGAVYCNRDYEPYARERDQQLYAWFNSKDIAFKGFKDQVIFEKNDITKADGTPYLVYSPYMRQWKKKLTDENLASYPTEELKERFLKSDNLPEISLEQMGFEAFDFDYPSREFNEEIIKNYHKKRNFPAQKGTTRLGMHLRFGTISIRKLTRVAKAMNEKFWNELIWREFFVMVLYHHPHSIHKAIKPRYDRISWENNEAHFKAWCAGKTGYPLVDAGMRELNETGFMHNRVRMVVASFLTKHLLIDWRWGEAYFAKKLLDFEQSSNVGGWQWAAGSGCDAAPYFRVFNPLSQAEKFDPQNKYIKRWVPELGTEKYPQPIVEHKFARARALDRFKAALS
jgi:deoxyribodipyrimidine photo-lyase